MLRKPIDFISLYKIVGKVELQSAYRGEQVKCVKYMFNCWVT